MPKLNVFSSYFKQENDTKEVTFLPPIKRGDLKHIKSGTAVLILDGYFASKLAIPPLECIQALRGGVKLYGASSIGALRASELYPVGFYGIGRVYQGLVRNIIYKDSDLLCSYCATTGVESSVSMVHLKYVLYKLAKKEQLFSQKDIQNKILNLSENIYWPERTLDNLIDVASSTLSGPALDRLKLSLQDKALHPKRLDALHALKIVKNLEV